MWQFLPEFEQQLTRSTAVGRPMLRMCSNSMASSTKASRSNAFFQPRKLGNESFHRDNTKTRDNGIGQRRNVITHMIEGKCVETKNIALHGNVDHLPAIIQQHLGVDNPTSFDNRNPVVRISLSDDLRACWQQRGVLSQHPHGFALFCRQ